MSSKTRRHPYKPPYQNPKHHISKKARRNPLTKRLRCIHGFHFFSSWKP